MKITVGTHEFKSALEKMFKATAKKSYTHGLKNILVKMDSNLRNMTLTASNLAEIAQTSIYADASADGNFIFSDTKALLKALKFFPAHSSTGIEYNGNNVTISCGGKKAEQLTLNAEDFPDFPELGSKLTNNSTYSVKKLKERFNAVKYAVSNGHETRSVLTGVHFNNADMVAIDMYRIAYNNDKDYCVQTPHTVPASAIALVNTLFGDNGDAVNIVTDEKRIRFSDGNTIVVSKLLEGEFLRYDQVYNTSGFEVEIDTKEFINSIKYLDTFSNSKCLIMAWYKNKIGYHNPNTGEKYESEIVIEGNTPNYEIFFNGRHIAEALAAQFGGKEKINICMGGNHLAPIKLFSEEDENNLSLIVPQHPNKCTPMFKKD